MSTPISAADTAAGNDIAGAAQVVLGTDTATAAESTSLRLAGATDTATATDSVTAAYVAATLWTVSPTAAETVHTTTPVFTLGVKRVSTDADTLILVVLQVSTTADFSSGVRQMSFQTPYVDGVSATTVTTTTALTPGTYYWRAKHYFSATWTPAVSFVVASGAASSTTVVGHWTLSLVSVIPTVWFALPPRARAGVAAVVFGAGLGAGGGSSAVDIGGSVADILSWTSVAATGDAYTGARVIDPLTAVISPEHSEVSIMVPALSAPGGPLQVTVDSVPPPPPFGTPLLWWVGDDVASGSSFWTGRGSVSATLNNSGAVAIPTGAALNSHQGLDITTASLDASFLGTIDLSAGVHLFAVLRPIGGAGSGAGLVCLVQAGAFTTQAYLKLATDGSNISTVTVDVFDNVASFDDIESHVIPSSVQGIALVVEWQYLPTTLRIAGSGVSTTPDPGNTGTPAGIVCASARVKVDTAPLVLYELMVFDTLSSPHITAARSYLVGRYGLAT